MSTLTTSSGKYNFSERLDDGRMIVNIGPQHPATHGTLRLLLELDGEYIVKCTPELGYLHSGFEKLGESMSYGQYMSVTDRMNYLSPLSNNIAYAEAVEKLLDIQITERCKYIRVILAELSRIFDHLLNLGTQGIDLGAFTPFLWLFEEREKINSLFEMMTGHRFTTSFVRIGGMAADLPEGFEAEVKKFLGHFPKEIDNFEKMLTRNRIWMDRTKGVGVISQEDAVSYGLSGPNLRCTGFEWDIRKEEPYDCYDHFDFDIPVGTNGDVYDRYLLRVEEMRQSVRIVLQALDNLPSGPVDLDNAKVRLPSKDNVYNRMESLIHHFKLIMDGHGLQPPKDKEIYHCIESPNGELGFYIVSDGTGKPYRVRTRPPSFIHYQVVPMMIEGRLISDMVAVLSSLNLIAGELDR